MARKNVLELFSSKPEGSQLSDFDLFWECYPRKKSKLDAMRAWQQTERLRPPIEELIAAVENLNKAHDWQRDPGGRYLLYPASWLRAGAWDDED